MLFLRAGNATPMQTEPLDFDDEEVKVRLKCRIRILTWS